MGSLKPTKSLASLAKWFINIIGELKPHHRILERSGMKHPQTASSTDRLLNTKEAAALLGVSARTVFSITKAGELAAVRIRGAVRYRPADLRAFIEARVG